MKNGLLANRAHLQQGFFFCLCALPLPNKPKNKLKKKGLQTACIICLAAETQNIFRLLSPKTEMSSESTESKIRDMDSFVIFA